MMCRGLVLLLALGCGCARAGVSFQSMPGRMELQGAELRWRVLGGAQRERQSFDFGIRMQPGYQWGAVFWGPEGSSSVSPGLEDVHSFVFDSGPAGNESVSAVLDMYTNSSQLPSLDSRAGGASNDTQLIHSYTEPDGARVVLWHRLRFTPDAQLHLDRELGYVFDTSVRVVLGVGTILFAGPNTTTSLTLNMGIFERDPRVIAHVALMSVTFCVIVLFGALTASFLPARWVKSWFRFHVSSQVLGMILMVIGFALMVNYKESSGFGHFGGRHSRLGLIIFCLVFVQAALGIFADRLWRWRYKKTGKVAAPQCFPQKTHWWHGRILIGASVMQVFLGCIDGLFSFQVYSMYVGYYAIVIVILIVAGVVNLCCKKDTGAGGKARGLTGPGQDDDVVAVESSSDEGEDGAVPFKEEGKDFVVDE